MTLPTDFSKRLGASASADAPFLPARAGSHAIETGIGAAMGAVLVGATGGSLVGPLGTLCGAVVGALVGAVAGKSIARYMEDTREDAYWRERPYVDTAFGFHDRDLTQTPEVNATRRRQGSSLADIAANPRSGRGSEFGQLAPGLDHARVWMRDGERSLSDLAAQGK